MDFVSRLKYFPQMVHTVFCVVSCVHAVWVGLAQKHEPRFGKPGKSFNAQGYRAGKRPPGEARVFLLVFPLNKTKPRNSASYSFFFLWRNISDKSKTTLSVGRNLGVFPFWGLGTVKFLEPDRKKICSLSQNWYFWFWQEMVLGARQPKSTRVCSQMKLRAPAGENGR